MAHLVFSQKSRMENTLSSLSMILKEEGLDFPSSTEIEEEGGIFLIIGRIPSSFL